MVQIQGVREEMHATYTTAGSTQPFFKASLKQLLSVYKTYNVHAKCLDIY